MSYEIDYVKKIKCPCGKGTIEFKKMSNDWNQTKESIFILCSDCKDIYEVVTESVCNKPKHGFNKYYCKNKLSNQKTEIEI